jgi:hypothetical protein
VPIWDSLPPAERRKYIHTRLIPGRVLLLHCDFTTPPKDKFLVITAVEPEPLLFIINSTVNEYIRKHEHLSRCQVEIGHKEHAFLRHHSFIDCTQAHRIALRDVYEQLERDIGRLKDEVTTQVREQIIAAVKFAKTLSAKQKTDIVSAFEKV